MKLKTVFAGCGAAILVTLPYMWAVLSSYNSLFYHRVAPVNSIVWGALIDLALSILAGILLVGYLERKIAGRRNVVWALLAAKIASLLAFLSQVWLNAVSPTGHFAAFVITLVAALALRWLWPPVYQAMARGLFVLCLLAGFSVLWIVPEIVYLGLHHEPVDWQGFARSVPADRLACRCTPPKSNRRIVWLLFDELSYDQTFEHRFPGLAMPAFDRLRSSSVLFENLRPAGYYTGRVVPSFFLGLPVQDVRSTINGEPRLQITGQSGWRHFDAQSTLFADAERAGWTTGVVGWYNPYCRILVGTVDFCYEEITNPVDISSDNSPLKNAVAPIASEMRLLGNKTNLSAERHEEDLRAIMAPAEALIKDEDIRFLFIHLPVPHPPGIYNRRTGQLRAGGTYIDNLSLADRSLAELLATISATASASDTTLIVCSDHSWRVPLWRPFDWTKEEESASRGKFDDRPVLMIHFPGQSSELAITQPFDEIKLHDILFRMLHGEMNSSEDLASWLQGNPIAKQTSITSRRQPSIESQPDSVPPH